MRMYVLPGGSKLKRQTLGATGLCLTHTGRRIQRGEFILVTGTAPTPKTPMNYLPLHDIKKKKNVDFIQKLQNKQLTIDKRMQINEALKTQRNISCPVFLSADFCAS